MLLLPQRKLFLSPNSNCSRIIIMGSKQFLLHKSTLIPTAQQAYKTTQITPPISPSSSSKVHIFSSKNRNSNFMLLASSPKGFFPIYQRASGYCSAAMPISRPINGVDMEALESQLLDENQLIILRRKLEAIGIDGSDCMPGQYSGLICPMCKGGDSEEKSLSLHITEDGSAAAWNCHRAKCGWKAGTRAFAEPVSSYERMSKIMKNKQPIREITEESLGLEPLCNELLAYFAERMISGETLRRNAVMQKRTGDQIAIAFTYRRNKVLVSCKYRDITKKFWQEAHTEKIFYGLDDIKEATDVIIVEGEMDKLAMEEAGFRNCVSVPDGAPPKASDKALP